MTTGQADQDSPWKELLDAEVPRTFAFFCPESHADLDWARDYESLEQELRQIAPQAQAGKRVADKLLKAYQLGSGDPRYFHLEVQGQREADFARRVHTCNYRAEDRFGQHVVSIVILIDDDPSWWPSEYVAVQYGCERTLKFRTVKLLDWRGKESELEAHPNPVALFVLAQLESRRTRDNPDERAAVKLRLISLLHGRKMEAEEVRQWYRYLDWFLPLPPGLEKEVWREVRRQEETMKMPFVTFAERYGREQGLLQGIEVALEMKFGAQGLAIFPEVQKQSDIAVLEKVLKAIKSAASIDEVRRLLPTNGEQPTG